MSEPQTAEASHEGTPVPPADAMIDPELADLPAPSRAASASGRQEEVANTENNNHPSPVASALTSTLYSYDTTSGPLGITESIALAPNPRPSDFNYTQLADVPEMNDNRLDFDTIMNNDTPGSPTTKIMKAVVPHNAAQAEPKWPPVSHLHLSIQHIHTDRLTKIRLDAREGGGGSAILVGGLPRIVVCWGVEWLFWLTLI